MLVSFAFFLSFWYNKTVVKVLQRYAKGLQAMENEANIQNEQKDAERYRFDKEVMNRAIEIVENGKE